jgi:hypothetical protein
MAQSKWLIAEKKKKKKERLEDTPHLINRSNNTYSLERSLMY